MAIIGPTLETSRLILRPPIQEDFEAYAALGQEEETMRFIGGTPDGFQGVVRVAPRPLRC